MEKFYMNDAQMEPIFLDTNVLVAVEGRGTGKSLIQALRMLSVVQLMPRSCSAFVTKSGTLAKRNTLPSIMQHWERLGYHKGIHYLCWRRPRKEMGWPRPIFQPETYDLVISWYTGAIIVIISQGDVGTSNSINFDHIFIDEAKFINFERLKNETFPANRGQNAFFGDCHLHHGMTITGDMPETKKGSWFLSYEEKYNNPLNLEAIEIIRSLVYEEWEIKKRLSEEENPPSYLTTRLHEVEDDLSFFRKKAVFYKEYSSLYNLALLGEEFFKQQKRDLPEATFYRTIMCEKSEVNKDGFYNMMKPHHKYTTEIFNYLGTGFDLVYYDAKASYWHKDVDLQLNQPLCIAIDYNDNINPMVIAQTDEGQRRINVVNSLFVKFDRKLEALCKDFDNYYHDFPLKVVVFYYDHTALNTNYAVNDQDYAWVITTTLSDLGWHVIPVYIGHAWKHREKNLLINRAFDGHTRLQPFFNATNCPDLLIAIREAGVYNGGKDKRDEKDKETQESLLEHRTDFTDAFDTLVIGCEKFPQLAYESEGAASYIPD